MSTRAVSAAKTLRSRHHNHLSQLEVSMSKSKIASILLIAFALAVDLSIIVTRGFDILAIIFAIIAAVSLIAILTGKMG